MKRKNRFISLLLCLALMIGLIPFIAVPAAAVTYTDGDWQFTVTDGEATITAYTGSAASVTIPASLTTKGGSRPVRVLNKTFYKNTTITSVTIPSGVTAIDNEAFCDCSKLASVTIPSTVKVIGYNAFCGCEKLTSVTIPNGVETIGMQAFGCTGLTTVSIPASVTSIGEQSFYCCSSLTKAQVFGPVTTIASGTFRNCSSLKDFVIDTAVSVGSYAFDYCTSLEQITIHDGVKTVEIGAFRGCSKLGMVIYRGYDYDWQTINIGSNNNYLLSATRYYIPITSTSGDWKYSYSETTGEVTIEAYTGSAASVTVPATLNGHPVTRLYGTFEGNKTITSVTIPNGVKVIGTSTFEDCSKLQTVNIPTTMLRIGTSAFRGCYELINVSIPASVQQIDDDAFGFCTSLQVIGIPDGVTKIEPSTFTYCYDLTSITIPGTVESIGSDAFEACSSLTEVFFDGSYNMWKAIAVSSTNNEALKNATIRFTSGSSIVAIGICGASGNNVTWTLSDTGVLTITGTGAMADYPNTSGGPWCDYAFSISSIEIGAGVTHIGDYAFSSCSNLYSVTIPLSVTSIGNWAFYQCDNLKFVYYGGSATSWNKITGDMGEPLSLAYIVYSADPLVISEITASKTSAAVGDTIIWTTTASGGTGTLQYAFYVYKDGAIIKKFSYGTDNFRSYKPTEPGSYHVKAFVKDGDGTAVSKNGGVVTVTAAGPVITAVTADKTTATVGDTVTWTTTATGGTGTLQYAFYIYKDGTIVKKFGYSTSSSRSYKPTEPGAYQVRAYVKDGNGTVKSKMGGAVTVNPGPPVITAITPDKTTAAVGDNILWTTTASGGTGTLQYAFYIYKDGTIVKKYGYSTVNSRSYKPTEPGSYQVRAYVKDGNGTVKSKMGGAVTVTAPATPVITSVTMNMTSCSVGDTITWTASATGGTGTLKYAFYLYQDGTIIQKTSYSTAKTFSYTPVAAGSYKVKAFVKDSAGKASSKLSGICLCST